VGKFKTIVKNDLFLYCLFIFLFFFVVSLLLPYGGDDWNNLLDGATGKISNIINIAVADFMTWEGRFFSRICLGFFVPKLFIWSVLNAGIMTFIFFVFIKIIKPKNKLIIPLLLAGLLFVDFETFAQVYVWKTGNITYLFPMFYVALLLYCRKELLDGEVKKDKWYAFLLLPILALPFSMFVENVSVGIIVICLFFVFYNYFKNRKIDVLMILCFVFSLIGLILMMTSPGTLARLDISTDFTSLSFVGKMFYNLPNLINYTFIKNSFLTLVMVVVLLVLIKKYKSKHRLYLYIFVLIVPIFTIFTNVLTFVLDTNIRWLWRFLDANNWYVLVYWIIFTIVLLYFVIKFALKEKNIKIIAFLLFAAVSNGAMMLAPVWGGRTAFFTTVMLYMVFLLIINDLDSKEKYINRIFVIINSLIMCFSLLFVSYSIYLHNLSCLRDEYIRYQIFKGNSEIEVIILPAYYTWNTTPWGDGFTAQKFKSYMGIKQEIPLKLVKKSEVSIDLDKLKK